MVFIWILRALVFVLFFLLLIIIVVLFAPIRYRLTADYEEKLGLHIKAAWLLRIFTVIYDTGLTPVFKLRIFGRAAKHRHTPKKNKSGGLEEDTSSKKPKKHKNKEAEIRNIENVKKSRNFWVLDEIKQNWQSYIEYPYKNAFIKKTLLLAKRILKALLPSQANGECRFGFDDPSTTGILLGAAHALLGVSDLYSHINISADFEKEFLYMKCHIAGKIMLWSLFWPLIAYIFSKPIWFIIKPRIFKRRTKG